MASLQQIVRNLNSKPSAMSLNERFAMLSSARATASPQQATFASPQQVRMTQSARAGWMSPPQMQFGNGVGVDPGAAQFANRMAAARMRGNSAGNRGAPIGVISGGGRQQARRGGSQRSPVKQMRSPQFGSPEQRAAAAVLRKASAQNRRLAQQMLARPTAVRLAQKLKKRSVMQRLGAKAGQSAVGRRSLGLGAKPTLGQRRSLGGLGSPNRSPLRAKSLLGGRLGAKRLSLSQRLGPKQGSPQKKQQQQQQKQQNGAQQRQQSGQQRNGNKRGGSANQNVRYFNAGQQQQNQQRNQNFNNKRGGRGGRRGRGPNNNNQQNRGQPSKQSLDADMDSYWQK